MVRLVALALCALPLLADTFSESVAPILARRCVQCHGPVAQNAGVRLDTLSSDLISDRRAAETWHDVRNALNRGQMPPKGAPGLTSDERDDLMGWLNAEIERAVKAGRATGGEVVMRRLNRFEYQNTMRDLLGLDLDYSKNLPPDEFSPDGFQNNGAALRMSALQLEYYLDAARRGLRRTIVEGPAPPVYSFQADETVEDKERATDWSNRLGRTGVFVARAPEFPDEGEFVVRVRAHAEIPEGSPYPRMHVTLGYRADTQTPNRDVGLVDVTSVTSREFEFRGRIEEFPLQSRTQSKYPGLLIWIRNVYRDGQPTPTGEKVELLVDGKKKQEWIFTEDPAFPKIVVESVEFGAPSFQAWPPEHHTRILTELPSSRSDEPAIAQDAVRRFMSRAFRRPAAPEPVASAMGFFAKVRPTVSTFEEAIRETLAMTLISPDFLYLVEDGDRDNYELASRLSYFLWSTMPDDRLMQSADADLSDPQTLSAEVDRMLDDPRAWAFVEQFSDQWLDLAGVDRIAINPNYYPDFDNSLKAEMRRETQHFFAEVLFKDLSALNFLRADFAMLNQPLAAHYGVDGPRAAKFERVSVGKGQGGLLTQASVLLANSTGEDSHPIERGVWVRSALLNDPPPPPPPSVPNLDNGQTDVSLLPLKQQLELHRDNAACASCHRGIDPWGIALEEFDAVGLRRETILRRLGEREERHPVDAAAVLPDGRSVDGVDDLTKYLVEKKQHEFARALTEKLLSYALGRSLEIGDEPTVEKITAQFAQGGYHLKHLITMIVTSEEFRGA